MKKHHDEAEIEELRERLREAEETLEAIRKHEVDALVVEGAEGTQIFTLQGADHVYRVFVEAMNEGAAIIMPDGMILHCNANLAELLKTPLQRIIGTSVYNLIESAGKPILENMIQVCGTKGCKGEFFLRAAKGPPVPVIISARLCMPDVETYCLVITDLSEQKRMQKALEDENAVRRQTEAALRESEQRWETTLSSIGDAVIAADTEGRVTFMNTVAETLTGWTLSEASKKPLANIFKIINEQTRGKVEDPIAKVFRGGLVVGLGNHTILVKKDGTEIPVDDSGAPIRGRDGRITGAVLVFRDVTERRKAVADLHTRTEDLQQAYTKLQAEMGERERLEQELRQAHKMEALGALTGGIAHDFNNILAAILGFSEMALDDVSRGTLLEKNIRHILNASLRARDLIRQMLAFSRKTEYEMKPMHLTPIVRETAKLLRASIPATVRFDVRSAATSDTILADATGIQQIVMNLGTNAAYSMREHGGVFSVILDDVDIEPGRGLAPGPYIRLTVRDTGEGMTPEVMKKIFDPFFTTKEVGQGTGMGLSVVYGIVKSLEGNITVESAPRKGSTFRVLFPKQEEVEFSEAPRQEMPTGEESILFIDDEEVLTELAENTLERLGYRVTALTDSTEALKLFSEDPSRFDLVITDQSMPKITGIHLAAELLKIRPDTAIILCTGHSDSVNPETAEAAGIKEFLLKPLARQELAEIVRKVLDERSRGELNR